MQNLPQTVCIPRLAPRSRAAVRSSVAAGSSWPEEWTGWPSPSPGSARSEDSASWTDASRVFLPTSIITTCHLRKISPNFVEWELTDSTTEHIFLVVCEGCKTASISFGYSQNIEQSWLLNCLSFCYTLISWATRYDTGYVVVQLTRHPYEGCGRF